MRNSFFHDDFVIGMVHLKPLPGSPNYDPTKYSMKNIAEIALEEALIYQEAGVDAIEIENQFDIPYHKAEDIGYETVAAMSAIVTEVASKINIPYGVHILMNGGIPAMAVSAATGASWIRVFEYVSAYISYTGLTEGIAGKLSRYRSFLKQDKEVDFLCDVHVKHGSHFIVDDRSPIDLAVDAQAQGADAVIVTGFATGQSPTVDDVKQMKEHLSIPLFVGSGVNKDNVLDMFQYADGAIVGSYFKEDGKIENPVDYNRVKEFMDLVKGAR